VILCSAVQCSACPAQAACCLRLPAGLTAIQAGLHHDQVGAAVLLDPVDFTAKSLRVARRYLAE
jgi:hypothetical protein